MCIGTLPYLRIELPTWFSPWRLCIESDVYPQVIETASDGRRATFRLRSDLTTANQPVYEMDGSGGVQARPSGTAWIRRGVPPGGGSRVIARLAIESQKPPLGETPTGCRRDARTTLFSNSRSRAAGSATEAERAERSPPPRLRQTTSPCGRRQSAC